MFIVDFFLSVSGLYKIDHFNLNSHPTIVIISWAFIHFFGNSVIPTLHLPSHNHTHRSAYTFPRSSADRWVGAAPSEVSSPVTIKSWAIPISMNRAGEQLSILTILAARTTFGGRFPPKHRNLKMSSASRRSLRHVIKKQCISICTTSDAIVWLY